MGAGWSTPAIVLTTVITVAIVAAFFILFCKSKIDNYFPFWTESCCCCQSLNCCNTQNDDKSLDLSANFIDSRTSTSQETRLEVQNELLAIPVTEDSMTNSHSGFTTPCNREPLINCPRLADISFKASTDQQLPPPSYEDITIFDNFRHAEPTAPPLEV